MKILAILVLSLAVAGCGEVVQQKPLTPAETHLIAQVAAKHAMHNLTVEQKAHARHAIAVLRGALASHQMPPMDVLAEIESFVGPEYADVAALAVVLLRERVNVQAMPPDESRPYIDALLAGLDAALK